MHIWCTTHFSPNRGEVNVIVAGVAIDLNGYHAPGSACLLNQVRTKNTCRPAAAHTIKLSPTDHHCTLLFVDSSVFRCRFSRW